MANAPYSHDGKSGPQKRTETKDYDDDDNRKRWRVDGAKWQRTEAVKVTRFFKSYFLRFTRLGRVLAYFGTKQRKFRTTITDLDRSCFFI